MSKSRLYTCKAKDCGIQYAKMRLGQVCCSTKCAMNYAIENRLKRQAKEATKDRQETRAKIQALKPRSEWMKKAQAAFNAFIRYRDKDKPCICCGRPLAMAIEVLTGGGYDCGHYRSTGSAPHLRFNEHNAHAQRKVCNRHGAGRAVDYRIGLIQRIGQDAVEALEADNVAKHYTVDDLKQIAVYYKTRLKELKTMEECRGK